MKELLWIFSCCILILVKCDLEVLSATGIMVRKTEPDDSFLTGVENLRCSTIGQNATEEIATWWIGGLELQFRWVSNVSVGFTKCPEPKLPQSLFPMDVLFCFCLDESACQSITYNFTWNSVPIRNVSSTFCHPLTSALTTFLPPDNVTFFSEYIQVSGYFENPLFTNSTSFALLTRVTSSIGTKWVELSGAIVDIFYSLNPPETNKSTTIEPSTEIPTASGSTNIPSSSTTSQPTTTSNPTTTQQTTRTSTAELNNNNNESTSDSNSNLTIVAAIVIPLVLIIGIAAVILGILYLRKMRQKTRNESTNDDITSNYQNTELVASNHANKSVVPKNNDSASPYQNANVVVNQQQQYANSPIVLNESSSQYANRPTQN